MSNNEGEEVFPENASTSEDSNTVVIQGNVETQKIFDRIRKVFINEHVSENQPAPNQISIARLETSDESSAQIMTPTSEQPSTVENISEEQFRTNSNQQIILEPQSGQSQENNSSSAESQQETSIHTLPSPPTTDSIYQNPPPPNGAPPSYSAVMRLGQLYLPPSLPRGTSIRAQPSPPFIAPLPPPTYTEIQGYPVERSMILTSDQMVWGPDPVAIVCPRCAHVIVTSTESHRSNLTHFSALALFLCGCWPCCLLPYCMDSCKNTTHHCPHCHNFLGMYRPW